MSRKGEAKRRKKKMLRNKELVKRYPWIAPVDWNYSSEQGELKEKGIIRIL